MDEQWKMAEHFSKMIEFTLAKCMSITERMVEFTVTTRKWLSSIKWLSTITKMAKHYRKEWLSSL
jgi:hypothetical protein